MSGFNITGGKELDAFLQSLPVKIEKNILRSALRQGANVFKAEVQATVPVGPPSAANVKLYGGYPGALRDSARVSVRVKRGRVTASLKIGGKTRKGADAFYAHMVEFGTRAHTILPKSAKALRLGGHMVNSIHHPGAKPHPFMRPALDSKAEAAVEAVGNQVRARLTKEGIDVPAPETD